MTILVYSLYNLEDVYLVLNGRTSELNDPNLIYYLALKRFEFDNNFINKNRTLIIKPVIANIQLENDMKKKIKDSNKLFTTNTRKEENVKKICNRSYPICVNEEDRLFQRNVVSILIMKSRDFPTIYEDYYSHDGDKYLSKGINHKYIETDWIVIERRNHSCSYYGESSNSDEEFDDFQVKRRNCLLKNSPEFKDSKSTGNLFSSSDNLTNLEGIYDKIKNGH
jgi:hypothetical protein